MGCTRCRYKYRWHWQNELRPWAAEPHIQFCFKTFPNNIVFNKVTVLILSAIPAMSANTEARSLLTPCSLISLLQYSSLVLKSKSPATMGNTIRDYGFRKLLKYIELQHYLVSHNGNTHNGSIWLLGYAMKIKLFEDFSTTPIGVF